MNDNNQADLGRLITLLKSFKGYQHAMRRVFFLRIMTTLDGFSIDKLDQLKQEQGVRDEHELKNVQFKCLQCGYNSYNYVDYENHLIKLHLPWSMLFSKERDNYKDIIRQPFNQLGLGEEDGFTYEEQKTFSLELLD